MGTEFNQISRDAQRALEEFSQEFAVALAQAPAAQWAKLLGLYRTSRALKTTFPIPVSAAGYAELKGDIKYRSLFEKSLELKPKTWQDGVSELASVIEAPDFIGWTDQPAAMATASMSLANEIIAGLLEANAVQAFDGKAFFASDHPCNVFDTSVGTYDNDITGAGTDLTQENLELAQQEFVELKGPNGKALGLRMTGVLVPPALAGTAKRLLKDDMLILTVGSSFGAVSNPNKGSGIEPFIVDEFTNSLQWYPLAMNKPGMHPWVVQDEGAPEEILSAKDSHLYKTTLKVGLAYVLRGNGGLALPQCIQRWAGTAP